MARVHVEAIETNVKGGSSTRLGARTVVIGPAGSGKSTIVNGCELALTGRASDVAGRETLARDAELWTLAPPGADRLFAVARLSDGSQAAWTLEKGRRAARVGLEGAFPLREVREALTGSPERARKWILEQAGGEIAWSDVEALIPRSLHARLEQASSGEASTPASEEIVEVLEAARLRARNGDSIARAARATHASASGLPPPPTDGDVEAARLALEEAIAGKARGELSARAESARVHLVEFERHLAEVRIALPTARALAQKAAGALDLARAQLEALPPDPAPLSELYRAALTVVEHLAGLHATSCPICGSKELAPATFAARAARARDAIGSSANASLTRGAAEAELARAEEEARNAECEAGRLEAECARLEAEQAALAPFLGPVAQTGEARPILTIEQAAERLEELTATRARWEAVQRSEEQALEAEREADEWRRLAEAADMAIGQLVERARVAFEARVGRYLPAGDVFGLELVDGRREIFRFGLRRPGTTGLVLHSALSGAEWARVTAALALATAPQDGPVIVSPEDRPFDPATLARVLEALGRVGEEGPQLVVTTPVEPAQLPEGWTAIRLTGEAPRIPTGPLPSAEPKKRGRRPKVRASPPEPPPPPSPPAASPPPPINGIDEWAVPLSKLFE